MKQFLPLGATGAPRSNGVISDWLWLWIQNSKGHWRFPGDVTGTGMRVLGTGILNWRVSWHLPLDSWWTSTISRAIFKVLRSTVYWRFFGVYFVIYPFSRSFPRRSLTSPWTASLVISVWKKYLSIRNIVYNYSTVPECCLNNRVLFKQHNWLI